ncbi:dihydrolipoyl dehydrogenase [Salsipaludibacter albus]|uniref:dihydrolipoyl dehydrogenase n=1 Tax=Salsipaludibacter albus TaxID=2849650 RepID=UPI001EE4947E
MADGRTFDVVVVGGGPGGYATAFRAAARGLDVAMVEQAKVGGTCLHWGCIPSKASLHVAELLEEVERGPVMGLDLTLNGIDGDELAAFRHGVVDRLHKGLVGLARQRTTLFEGRGRLVEAGVVAVTGPDGEEQRVEGRHVVIATGSRVRGLPSIEVDGRVVQTSDDAVHFTEAPGRAVIIGAGAIGMEFASMWAPMGTEVTIVEALDRVLPLEDADVSDAVAKAYRSRGIDVHTGATVSAVEVDGDVATVTIDADGSTTTLEVDCVLVAVGRAPRTDDLGIDDLLDDRGFVVADAYGATATDGVWAVGDVLPTLALAHAAFVEGFVVADRIAGVDDVVPVDHTHTPRVTYCHPEAASVGLTEAQAVEQHGDEAVSSTTVSLMGNAKGIIAGSKGFAKVIALRDGPGVAPGATGEVLGVHVVGPHATDLVAEGALATSWGALPEELGAISHAHPTLYEALGEAWMSAAGLPFHVH